MKLHHTAIYVNAASTRLEGASRLHAESAEIRERKRWVTGADLLAEAKNSNVELPLVFAQYADLTFWALARSIKVDDAGTTFTFGNLRHLKGFRRSDLTVASSRAPLPDNFIRSYSIIETPGFLLEQLGHEDMVAADSPLPLASRTFLLTWNPSRWAWPDLPSAMEALSIAGKYRFGWSAGKRVDLPLGSRIFLMRLGTSERGLVASGWTCTEPAEARHWEPDRADRGDTTPAVDVDFDVLSTAPLLDWDQLRREPFDTFSFTPQSGGVEIPPAIAVALERLWIARTTSSGRAESDVPGTSVHWEGALRRMYANVFERDAAARSACLAHYGANCVVCNFSFPATYGNEFSDSIHVHHCVPLSTIRKAYSVDPLRDLRPVCPNCHAALHQRTPPYEVDELRAMMREVKRGA